MQLVRTEQENNMLKSEIKKANEMVKHQNSRQELHEKKIGTMEFQIEELHRKLREKDNVVKNQATQIDRAQSKIAELEMELQHQKQRYESKFAGLNERAQQKLQKEIKEATNAMQVSVSNEISNRIV